MTDREEWRTVEFNPGYEVSSLGRVRNALTLGVMKPTTSNQGYHRVHLGGVQKRSHTVHKLVAHAWLGPRPDGLDIDHIDGEKLNNKPENLRYLTRFENIQANVKRRTHAFGSKHGSSKLTEAQVAEIREAASSNGYFWGARAIAERMGVDEGTVRRAANGISFEHSLDRDMTDQQIVAGLPEEMKAGAILGFRMAERMYRQRIFAGDGLRLPSPRQEVMA